MRERIRKKCLGVVAGIVMGVSLSTVMTVAGVSAAEQVTPLLSQTESPAATETPAPSKVLTELAVQSAPMEIAYGATLQSSQVVLKVGYNDGTAQEVNPEKIDFPDAKKLGNQTITFYYQGEKIDWNICVLPRKVSNIVMKGGTSDSMKVAWDELEEAERYDIYLSPTKEGKYTFVAGTENFEYTFQNLVQGQVYYIKICAIAKELTGAYSQEIPIAAKPEKVSSLTVTKTASTTMSISWQAATGATGYAVYYKRAKDSDYIYAGSTDALKYTLNELISGKQYNIIVRAYAADISNESADSKKVTYGTAPAVPVMTSIKGGDKRLKIYWKKSTGAEMYRIYISTKPDADFVLKGQISSDGVRIFPVDNLSQNQMYYVKMEASRDYKGTTLTATSLHLFASTKKADATSTTAKNYATTAKFKKSPAYKNNKAFRNKLVLSNSYVTPGLKTTNVGGINTTRMVPQSVTFLNDYLLISAYDQSKAQESVIYVMDKKKKSYITTLVLPHQGHVGGMAYDGENLWISHGKKVECIKKQVILDAAKEAKAYTEIYSFATEVEVPDTASYLMYYKEQIWVGTYSETAKKYMYGFAVSNKTETPSLTQKNKMLMPNRTQGVSVSSNGKMIISRSCQTKPGQSGFLCQLDVYEPTWNLAKTSVKKNKRKKVIQMPPMNEGIVISGAYTYLIFESSSFSQCAEPVDRVTAFKTNKLIK